MDFYTTMTSISLKLTLDVLSKRLSLTLCSPFPNCSIPFVNVQFFSAVNSNNDPKSVFLSVNATFSNVPILMHTHFSSAAILSKCVRDKVSSETPYADNR